MKILLAEPFFSGSHASWATGYQKHSRHEVDIISLPGRHWKWRMHGGAVSLARVLESRRDAPDLLLATDMLDVAVFLGLARRRLDGLATGVYFHENQLSYPWSPQDRDVKKGRDFHYGFINWTTALAADRLYFNSEYNRSGFFDGVRLMLRAMPDARELDLLEEAVSRSRVLPLGIELSPYYRPVADKDLNRPVLLWNHRWEYDKNPDSFFRVAARLQEARVDFGLIVCGESFERYPAVFDSARELFSRELLHWGYAADRREYKSLLTRANVLPVTSRQEFFGQSMLEAVAAGCYPILPDALAYPAHVPPGLRDEVLYTDEDGLFARLLGFCRQPAAFSRSTRTLQQVALQYDWSRLAPVYDEVFELEAVPAGNAAGKA